MLGQERFTTSRIILQDLKIKYANNVMKVAKMISTALGYKKNPEAFFCTGMNLFIFSIFSPHESRIILP